MSIYFFKMLFAMLVCLSYAQGSIPAFNSQSHFSNVKCIETERQALLNFKHGIIDDYGILSTWRDDDNSTDCCSWEGIQCNNQTGHILILDLHGQYPQKLRGAINITSLIHLQNIEYMDLSHNFFSWSTPQLLGSITNLRYLNLSWSGFYGQIPSELGNLSKLEYLDLSSNDNPLIISVGSNSLSGAIPHELRNLSQLKYLDLLGNSLSGAIPFQVGNLPMLHTLRLGGNFDLKVNDAKWLSSLSLLSTLGLSSLPNLVSSRHWQQLINELIPNLRELRLVNCSLSDNDFSSLFRFHTISNLSILDLSDNMLTSSMFQLLSNYSLNLQELYLYSNDIVLSSPHHLNFPSLMILDLSDNNLTSAIFQGNFNFPSLVILDLSYNNLTSAIFQGKFNFSSRIQEINLASCYLTDKSFLVPSAPSKNSSSSVVTLNLSSNLLKSSTIFHCIFNFTINLRNLYLSENMLEGPIPDEFGKVMSSLEVLYLQFNELEGEIPSSLGHISTLQELFLNNYDSIVPNSYKRFTGMLPDLSNLTYLRILDISQHRLTGELPKSIWLLHELEYLHLEGNSFEGNITESHLTNLSKLKELDLTDNSLSLKFDTTWVPPFQLATLGLASCELGPSFPSWIHSQSHLQFLDISDAGIDDFIPEGFWNKLQSIILLNMSCNNLKGTIPNLPIKLKLPDDDQYIILNSNELEGEIPVFLSQVYTLDLSHNKISNINTFLCGKRATANMLTLDLSNNQITGHLPDCWEHLKSLGYLDLSNNKLSGKIPQSVGTLVNLKALALQNNNLTGELPFTLKNCSSLVIFDVGENSLSGPIPSWIGESLQQLKILSLRVNHFFGSVPVHLCYLNQIHLLDLSRNNLSGGIPTCIKNFTAMKERGVTEMERERKISSEGYYEDIYVSDVLFMWKGQDHEFWNPEYLLKSIDLSSNDLTGELPKVVGYLLGLVSLNLSRNNLEGEIPSEIGNLSSLEFLDLSRNHFSGEIPSTLSKIYDLSVLNLSNNDLTGRIPWGSQLQTFDASSFEGNRGLCGEQLNKSCPGEKTTTQPQAAAAVYGEDDNSVFYEALYMSLGIGFFAGFWGLLGPILLWQPWRTAYGRFLNKLIDNVFVMVQVKKAKFHRWLRG